MHTHTRGPGASQRTDARDPMLAWLLPSVPASPPTYALFGVVLIDMGSLEYALALEVMMVWHLPAVAPPVKRKRTASAVVPDSAGGGFVRANQPRASRA